MYVKLLDGRFAGETRELAPGAARDLIALGRAEKAFQDPAPEVPAIVARMDESTDGPHAAAKEPIKPASSPSVSSARDVEHSINRKNKHR